MPYNNCGHCQYKTVRSVSDTQPCVSCPNNPERSGSIHRVPAGVAPCGLSESEVYVIRGLAKNGLRISRTAEALHYHWNSVNYNVRRVKAKTGLDPTDFYDMQKLLDLVGDDER